MRSIITLTTDFGASSPYVAQMKGVILSLCRDVEIVDVTHSISPQNIREGAVVVADVTPRFPAGTLHVVVVDPGVGTGRKIVYVEIGEQRYIAPDNGVLSQLAEREAPGRVIVLENRDFWLPVRSDTFQGRDIMAPVAAHLALGTEPNELGRRAEALVDLEWPEPIISSQGVAGEVLLIDSFGNAITNIGREDVAAIGEAHAVRIDCGGRRIRGIVATYGAAMGGEFVAVFDSQGRLEIAKVEGNAAKELQIEMGERVLVTNG
jgi:S-adenosylmethionine hydrolase